VFQTSNLGRREYFIRLTKFTLELTPRLFELCEHSKILCPCFTLETCVLTTVLSCQGNLGSISCAASCEIAHSCLKQHPQPTFSCGTSILDFLAHGNSKSVEASVRLLSLLPCNPCAPVHSLAISSFCTSPSLLFPLLSQKLYPELSSPLGAITSHLAHLLDHCLFNLVSQILFSQSMQLSSSLGGVAT
jgi:hypothetical protein